MNWRLCLLTLITITAQLASWFPNQLNAATPSEARVTRVSNSVQLLCSTAADFPCLRSEQSVVAEDRKQPREKSKKTLINTNLVIFGGGMRVSLVGPGPTAPVSRTTAPVAPATPRREPKLSPEAVPASQ